LIPKGTEIPVLDRDVLRLLRSRTRPISPRDEISLQQFRVCVAALMVEARSGSTFAQFLRKSIFQPLKMSNTLATSRAFP